MRRNWFGLDRYWYIFPTFAVYVQGLKIKTVLCVLYGLIHNMPKYDITHNFGVWLGLSVNRKEYGL